jgi:hypothetical protein
MKIDVTMFLIAYFHSVFSLFCISSLVDITPFTTIMYEINIKAATPLNPIARYFFLRPSIYSYSFSPVLEVAAIKTHHL